MITALPAIPLAVGTNRVVRGVRVPHVCGDPTLSKDEDWELGLRITKTALDSLATEVSRPTLFEPSQTVLEEVNQ
jgi:glycine/betaine/sarcosine/D-proline reductase family selenoprotein B